jgi:hypothetical protein
MLYRVFLIMLVGVQHLLASIVDFYLVCSEYLD